MKKYICEGATVQRKTDTSKQGVVVSFDRDTGVIIAQQNKTYWSDRVKNVEVVSYKEVK